MAEPARPRPPPPAFFSPSSVAGGTLDLESLLETSKTPRGRSLLASRALVPDLLLLLPTHPDPLPLLRLLRNLCAGDPSNQLSFLRSGGPLAAASLVLAPSAPTAVARIGLQLLANVAAAAGDHASAVWERLYPAGLLDVLRARDEGVLDAVCMILYTCCFSALEGTAERRRELCSAAGGVEVAAAIVRSAAAVEYQGDWLELFLSRLCFEEPCFLQLFKELGFPGITRTDYSAEQAFLLKVLSEILDDQKYGGILDDHKYGGVICSDFALSILQVLKNASDAVDFSSKGSQSLPTGFPAIDTLGFSLTILKNLCALDYSFSSRASPIDLLLPTGVCQFLLGLLRDLEPPLIIKKSLLHGQKQGMTSSTIEASKLCPYKGFRRDIVAVLGNCMFGRKDVQDEVRMQNGIMLLLQQCVVDEENPFLREWGIWTVRCMLEGNPENQKQVADLEIQGSVNTPEITDLGLRVEIDQKTRRAKLINTSQ